MTSPSSTDAEEIEAAQVDGMQSTAVAPAAPADAPATPADAEQSPDSALVVEATSEKSPSRFSAAAVRSLVFGAMPALVGIGVFLVLWAVLAPQVQTSLGELPGPVEVLSAGDQLWDEYQAERAKESTFYADQEVRNAEFIASGQPELVQDFTFPGAPTFPSQIWTSLQTVAVGFLIGALIAIPVGLLSGLSNTFRRAISPLVEIFKPVSPLAWLPIVTLVVSATVTSNDSFLPKSFIVSALVVTLNSLWPTLINTSVGASSVDQDLLNVGEVLRLGPITKLRKIILPSAMPYIFTGMRLSLGVGWMVLIAAEMLAQNPGLGKFVWDEFQNGSSQSLSRIMFAVLVIGVIGFLLDRLMGLAESLVSRNRGM